MPQGNSIGDDGACALASCMTYEEMSPEALLEPVEHKVKLECVSLDQCAIGDTGGEALQKLFPSNYMLKSLSVEGNTMSEAIYNSIRDGFISNKYW